MAACRFAGAKKEQNDACRFSRGVDKGYSFSRLNREIKLAGAAVRVYMPEFDLSAADGKVFCFRSVLDDFFGVEKREEFADGMGLNEKRICEAGQLFGPRDQQHGKTGKSNYVTDPCLAKII